MLYWEVSKDELPAKQSWLKTLTFSYAQKKREDLDLLTVPPECLAKHDNHFLGQDFVAEDGFGDENINACILTEMKILNVLLRTIRMRSQKGILTWFSRINTWRCPQMAEYAMSLLTRSTAKFKIRTFKNVWNNMGQILDGAATGRPEASIKQK